MVDIFNAKEGTITLEDIHAFLGLDAASNQRPREGVTIDYKGELPSDLAKLIAAFANTDGGIAFIGVEEERGVYRRSRARWRKLRSSSGLGGIETLRIINQTRQCPH